MSADRKRFAALFTTALPTTALATVLSILALPITAQAADIEARGNISQWAKIATVQNDAGRITLTPSDFEPSDIKKLQDTLSDQARQIEELKRSSGTSSSSSNKDIDELKRTVKEQERQLDNQSKQIEDLKRSSGSSSSSSSSEISNLKRDISEQDRTIDQLKRTVEELSRKVK